LLGNQFGDYGFIDIGCGKGKVQIVWEQLLRKNRISQPVYGLDYYDALIEQAQANLKKVLGREGRFICADASEFDYSRLGYRLIVYLYNPFDGVILDRVLDRLERCDVVVIYNNPEHAAVLLDHGFKIVREKKGFHPQAWTVVYQRRRTDAGV
jgi:SAM-dependent methyltransferase